MMFSVESINQLSNRSLTDRTQDSDSCNVGSIPAGCIFPPVSCRGIFYLIIPLEMEIFMLKQQQGYVLSKIGPHTYLLPYGQSIADQKHGIIINETGEFLWKMLETPQSMDTLITALAGHYQMDSSEISELSEDVVQFIRQLISLGIVQDLSKASDDSHPMILSIAGLHISLTGVPSLYPDQLSAFCVPDLSVNSGTFTTHIPADMTIELLHQTPPFHQNGTVLLRSKELIVLETCDGYVLLFPSLAGISDVYLSSDGTYARIYCTGNADCNTKEQLFHVIRHLFLYRAQTTDKFALHSASILYKGKAWLFSGHSGMGKSTHTALWHKYFQTPYLNGDLNLNGFENKRAYSWFAILYIATSSVCNSSFIISTASKSTSSGICCSSLDVIW